MGGDHALHSSLEGALLALPDLRGKDIELVLLGDEQKIRAHLAKRRMKPLAELVSKGSDEQAKKDPAQATVTIKHTFETIGMEDSIRAVRTKPDASLNIGCGLAAAAYKAGIRPTAFISAGHSGAMLASALLHMGRLRGVERPAIAVKLPTLSANGCVILDVGANVDCKPEHLRDFAVMGALFAQVQRRGTGLPRVALLSNGEEPSKGNELTRASMALIEKLECFQTGVHRLGSFVGYAEGKEIFKGQVDVVVADGFVGNVVLKSLEGLGSAVIAILKKEAKKSVITPLGFLFAAAAFRRLKRKLDYAEYGAAPLLGVAGYAFICHGRSNSRAMKNALLRAHSALEERLVERLEFALVSTSGQFAPDP
jgi:glycerol-3-phosphate acyltransferase PlsX